MENNLTVSSSPHIRSKTSTRKIMLDVIIALLPCVVASCIIFSLYSLVVLVFCVCACVLLEYACRLVMKREQTIGDLSAAVTGLLLGLTLPVGIDLSLALVGCIVAIVIVKQCFGGIGNNFVNPAMTARIVMLVSFPTQMTTWTAPRFSDALTTATPLSGGTADLSQLFFGTTSGCLGETCALAILIGFVYLLVRRVIKPVIPLMYIGTVAVFSLIVGKDVLFQVLSGGLLFGAVFMATDYTTSPFTTWGKVIYGFGCGFLTVIIRFFAALPEGVSYAVVLMNILVPLIEHATLPRAFGKDGQK